VAGAATEALAGVALLGRGLGLVARRPRLFVLGAIPPLVTSTLFVVVLVLLFTRGDAVVAALTGFADGWGTGPATLVGCSCRWPCSVRWCWRWSSRSPP
jgi:CysZ protein